MSDFMETKSGDTLREAAWTQPDNYGGFSPEGHFVIATRTRDSDVLTDSNWSFAGRLLAESAGLESIQAYQEGQPFPPVYDWRAGHWACGWIEYLMVSPDAPESVLQCAADILDSLAGYPVLDDDDFSEREQAARDDFWQSCDIRERADYIRKANEYGDKISIFAARRDYPPSSDSGVMDEILNGY